MNRDKAYTGIDYFRFLAAFLIIAIHTSPLSSFSETGDFILTRIVARVGVPFFFMTSGFFLISRYTYGEEKLAAFVKKTVLIYGISIAVYIPVNIYNGYFSMDHLLPNIIKDLFFDGTMYHLWYLPASVIGGILAWLLVKRWGLGRAFLISFVLYVIGLFGDSYYGIAKQLPVLKAFYSALFEVSDYTRNGIFFAPVFFVLGGIVAEQTKAASAVQDGFGAGRCRIPAGHAKCFSLRQCLIGFGISFAGMFAEGLILHNLGVQRHDSMYFMLLPCMYFLFMALTFLRGKRVLFLRTSAMLIYMIHPMVIVAVRLAAKVIGIQSVLVDNSLVHYCVVSVLSAVFGIFVTRILDQRKGEKAHPTETGRAWLEINQSNLEHNVKILKEAMPKDCELMAVVKAEAYGHGAFEVASCVNRVGVHAFAVATIDEGIELRRYGILGEILILGYTPPVRAKELRKFELTQTVVSFEHADSLNRQRVPVKVHIKIDTGMHRLGFDFDNEQGILKVFRAKNLDVQGIYTHLCVADSQKAEDIRFTKLQISRFYGLLDVLAKKGIKIPKIHIQSSYGFLNYPELKCDYVRAGVSLYGVLSSPGDQTRLQLDLRPVLSLKSRVVLLRKIKCGDTAGYGRMFQAQRDSRIAVLSVGYADGLPRNLSCENGKVIIRGYRVPVIGRVCMDQLLVDVTDIPDVVVGDIATLIGTEGDSELSAAVVADDAGSISNELLSRLGGRLKIITKN